MNERTEDRTRAEARREVATHPDRRSAQDDMIRVYLAGEAYAESHDHPSQKRTTTETGDKERAGRHGAGG